MGLRIAPNLYSTLLYAVTNDRQNLNTDLQQISSGKSVNLPSDNPAATSSYIADQAQSGSNDAFEHSISTIQGALTTADSTPGSVINNLNQALSLGVEGANGTNSPAELQGMAQEIQAIQQTVLGLANTSYQGAYLFAGTNVTAAPYAASALSPSGVSYAGNAETNTIQVGPEQFVTTNLPGSRIFNSAGADVFQALHDLSVALSTNTNIKVAPSELTTAFNAVNSQRTFYGNTLNQLTSINSSLTQEQLTLSQQEGTLISADTAKAASNLAQDQTSLQGALQAFGGISRNTLLNYWTFSRAWITPALPRCPHAMRAAQSFALQRLGGIWPAAATTPGCRSLFNQKMPARGRRQITRPRSPKGGCAASSAPAVAGCRRRPRPFSAD